MTASAPTLQEVAPNLQTRVQDGALDGSKGTTILVGIVALVASLIGYFTDTPQFAHSYLVAYMFVLSIVLGAMFFVLIQHITRAGWSVVVRRIAENMMGTMTWMAILFIPIVVTSHDLFHHWMDAVIIEGEPGYDRLVAHKSGYLNTTFFFARAVIYFVVWILIARYFRNASLEQDKNGDPAITMRLARRAAPALILFAMTLTFAAFDWIMSLDPHWFSTMFGVTYFAGSVMGFYAMLALISLWLRRKGFLKDVINVEHYHDIGKLLFAFMVFWTYVNFSQYMLIFYANIPEETMWYAHRAHGSWKTVGTILIFGHFLAPFVFMMSRNMKRNRPMLAFSAIYLLVMHWFDMQFLIMPNIHADNVHLSWLDATTMIAMLALFAGLTLRNTIDTPLVPERDPRLGESLHFHNI